MDDYTTLRLETSVVAHHVRALDSMGLPSIDPTTAGLVYSRDGGGIAYDPVARRPVYNDNQFPQPWKPFTSGGPGPGGSAQTFSLSKNAQTILPATVTKLTGWSLLSPNFDRTGDWNQITGTYTATGAVDLHLTAVVTWTGNESNSGTRTLQIVYRKPLPLEIVVATVTRQAEADIVNASTQTASVAIPLSVGDQVWAQVSHTSIGPLNIDATSRMSGTATAP